MGDVTGGPVVHSWDTERRRVLCGAVEQTRSTKHASGVTCPGCREQLAARAAGLAAPDGASPHDGG